MRELDTFGMPLLLNEETGELDFPEGVAHSPGKKKKLSEMRGLLYDDSAVDDTADETCYVFYSEIVRAGDEAAFRQKGFLNGITVLMPGTMRGECRKNSGHFHGFVKGHALPFPEVYEVLLGKAVFLLQKSMNFYKPEEELKIDECRAVFLNEGEKIVVPPFTAHCASNVGDGPMAFGNFAAPCPLLYDPVRTRHGLCYYLLKEKEGLVFVPNRRYRELPQLRIAHAKEAPELGIAFDTPVYRSFLEYPERFDYLSDPEPREDEILRTLV